MLDQSMFAVILACCINVREGGGEKSLRLQVGVVPCTLGGIYARWE